MKTITTFLLCIFGTLILCSCRKYTHMYWYYYRVETNSPRVSVTYIDAIGRNKVDSIRNGYGWICGFMSGESNPKHGIIVQNDTTIGWIKVQWMRGKDTLQMASDSGRYIKVKL